MRHWRKWLPVLLLVSFFGLIPALGLLAAWPAPAWRVAIRCGRLIDVKTGTEVSDAVILIDGDRISKAGTNVSIPGGSTVIDLSHETVLPGLIDTHTHLTYHYDTQPNERLSVTAIYAAESARRTLLAGFTTVRNLGAGDGVDLELEKAIDHGVTLGPRMISSGIPLFRLSDDGSNGRSNGRTKMSRLDRIREVINRDITAGAGVIKVFVTPGAGGGDGLLFSEDEVRLIGEEAAKAHLKVAAHAHATAGIKAAVRAGVASVEHGSKLDDEAIRLMIEHHTALVPTLYLPNHYIANREKFGFDEARWQALQDLRSQSMSNFKKALAAGVWIVMGSDAVAGLHGENAKELEWMVKGGMTPAQAIQAATIDAAQLLGVQDRAGSIEAGKLADIIAVSGDPLQNITTLQNVSFVMKGGQVVKENLARRPRGTLKTIRE